jgi:hypothetical protein
LKPDDELRDYWENIVAGHSGLYVYLNYIVKPQASEKLYYSAVRELKRQDYESGGKGQSDVNYLIGLAKDQLKKQEQRENKK